MAFNLKGWAETHGDGTDLPRAFQYKSDTDALADINTAGYFNTQKAVVRVNDTIKVIDSSNVHATLIVNQITSAGVVDTTDGDVVSATDTD